MCKLFIASGPLKRVQVEQILDVTAAIFGRTETDGYGFLAARQDQLAMGRYEEPEKFPGFKKDMPSWVVGNQNELGEIPEETTSLIVHGRTSTNIRGIAGCHPFEYKGFYLAHNGMVMYSGPVPDPVGDVDSDQYLHWLVDNGLNWDESFKSWGGWGAIGLYDSHRDVLTVARDCASLYIARRANREGWVFATSKDHLEGFCNHAEIQLDTIPIQMPTHIVTFRGSELLTERKWFGFAARAMTKMDRRAAGGRKNNKKRNENHTPVQHGQYQLPEHIQVVKPVTELATETTKESFPDYTPAANTMVSEGGVCDFGTC